MTAFGPVMHGQVTSPGERKAAMKYIDSHWKTGTVRAFDKNTGKGMSYRYDAKVYDEGSEFGINGGRISKLWIEDSRKFPVASYDRGWDIKPTSKEAEAALAIILELYK